MRLRKILVSLSLALSAISALKAQEVALVHPEDSVSFLKMRERMDSIRRFRPTVALVLSGGGAKSAAQLSPIAYLQKVGIPVDAVIGTSMGGLVAGMMSVAMDTADMEDLVRKSTWMDVVADIRPRAHYSSGNRSFRDRSEFVVTFGKDSDGRRRGFIPRGLSNGQNMTNLLNSITVGYNDKMDFADLPVPFLSVSTDLVTGKPTVFYGGTLSGAIMSTFSVPGLFALERRSDGKVLSDGAFYNNYPVDVVRNIGADIVVGVDITATKSKAEDIGDAIDALMQSFDMQGIDAYYASVEDSDLYLRPEIDDFSMFMFDPVSIDTLVDRGKALVRRNKAALDSLAAIFTGCGQSYDRPPAYRHDSDLAVSSVRFEGVTPEQEAYLRRLCCITESQFDGTMSPDEALRIASIIRGSGLFEKAVFRFEGKCEPFDVVFECTRIPRSVLGAGIRFDVRDYFSLGLDSRFNVGGHHSVAVRARIGMRSSVMAEYNWTPSLLAPSLFAAVKGENLSRMTAAAPGGTREELGNLSAVAEAGLEIPSWRYWSLKAGARAEFRRFKSVRENWLLPSLFIRGGADSFDNHYFPTKGLRACVSYSWHIPYGSNFTGHVLSASAGAAVSFGRLTLEPHADVRTIIGSGDMPVSMMNSFTAEYSGRYFDHEIAFAGMRSNMVVPSGTIASAGADIRVNVSGNHHAGARADVAIAPKVFPGAMIYYGMDSPFGPVIRAGLTWASHVGMGACITVGKDF